MSSPVNANSHHGRLSRAVLAGVLIVYAVVLMFAAARMAPTYDEPAHLAAGLYTWRSGWCSLYNVNPPLTKLMAAVPVLLAGAREDWSRIRPPPARPELMVGNDFVTANGPSIFWLVTLGRWGCLPFPVLGAYLCYRWGRELFGSASGWVALLLWCGCPTILGHGALLTADVPAAAVGLLAGYSFWRWLERPSLEGAVWNGVVLGLCWLVKLTWVILPGIWLCVWSLHRWGCSARTLSWQRGAGHLGISVLVGLMVLHVGYGFEGSLTPLGAYRFHSSLLTGQPVRSPVPIEGNRFMDSWVGRVPLPLPSPFVQGLDAQRQDFEEPHDLYFAGRRSEEGWWYFYLAAFLLKEPVGFLALLAAAGVYRVYRHRRWEEWARLAGVWLPPMLIIGFVSAHPRLNYYRYILPALPFLFLWTGGLAEVVEQRRRRPVSVLVILGVVWHIVSGFSSVPYSISYVNALGGGMRNGDAWFIDSNFDWGQDLFALRRWQQAHPEARPLMVCYFGPCPPELAAVDCVDPPVELLDGSLRPPTYQIPPGWYALSASVVHATERTVPGSRGRFQAVRSGGLNVFEAESPLARAGGSILIYHVVRREGAVRE